MQTTRLVYSLFAVGSLLTLGALIVAYLFLGEVLAIKGSYLLLGIVLAAVLYRERIESDTDTGSRRQDHLGRWSIKLVFVLTITAYIVTYLTGARFEATVVTLGVGYSVLAYQILFRNTSRAVIPQIGLLFTVSPVTKYLSTGFYFGATDLLGHVRAVELLYQTGRLKSITTAYETYNSFPALHILSGAISSFTGMTAYDSLMVLGIVTYTVVTIGVFYLCRMILSPSKSIAITFVFSVLNVVHNYTSYFFPQALATALIIFLIYVAVRRRSLPRSEHPPLSLTAVLVTACVVVAHHVTQLLFVGLISALYAPSILRRTEVGQRLQVNEDLPRFIPILFALTAGITYLFVITPGIVDYFIQFTTNTIDTLFVSDTGGDRVVVGLGTEIPYHTPRIAVESLFYVDGLYYIGMAALFIVGMVTVVVHYDEYTRIAGFILVGIGGALAVLKTPLPTTASRLSLPLAFFFAIVTGIGLWQLTKRESPNGLFQQSSVSKREIAVFGLIVLVGTTGPLVASDDLYGLHAGPNLWETYSTPEEQVEFSDQELQEFETMVGHVDQHTSEVTMLWVSREASDRFGGEERLEPSNISDAGIQAESPLVYRTNWTNHQVGYAANELGTLAIADWWLDREINASNKVYTTGKTGIVGTENGTNLSADREAEG